MEIVSSLHVLNVHIRYVHYTYTYSKNFARLTANLSFMLRAFRRRPRCLPSLRLLLNRSTSVSLFGFFWFWKTSFERKRTNKQKKKRAWEPKKTNKSSYLIDVWRLWMRPIESHFVLLCWYFSAKPTHCRKMSTPALVSISHLGADRGTVQSYWKSARCFLNVFHLRSKCEI